MTNRELSAGRRLFLIAYVPGPVVALGLSLSLVLNTPSGEIETGTAWGVVLWVAVSLGFLTFGYAKRNSPSWWPKIVAVSVFFFGALTGLAAATVFVVHDMPVGVAFGLGAAVFVVCGIVPWVVVTRAATKVIELPAAAMVESEVELSFPLRGEDDGWFLVGQDEVQVRIRRRVRRQLDDNHDDRVDFTGIRELEMIELREQEKTHVGLGYEAHATDGPAVRLLILSDSRSDEPEEWIVATDRAWEAIQAIEARRLP
ncbi:hypothetical protein [Amycolatopsis sp.]|uniref:hypothetical protein n=1 Tax=Amycolatopsis sp. TaxID=37632 RepID=UPI002E0AD686|nr:hypothetical protein [Amycolatopsis sp.]